MERPPSPALHREFLDRAIPLLQSDGNVLGVAAAGSYVAPGLDEHPDLDIVVVVSDADLPTNRKRRTEIAEKLGDLVASFTGEHVGEPRLLICLYGPPLLHVDLKFTTIEGFKDRVEDPTVLYDPSGELGRIIREFPGTYPPLDLQWAEDRIWIWVHFTALKLRRGELLTAKQSVDYMLQRIIGPLILSRAGVQPNQLRRLEQVNPPELAEVWKISSASDQASVKAGLESLIEMYLSLRAKSGGDVVANARAEAESRRFLAES